MVKSWDYFDTLHGRTTGCDPWRMFDLVAGEEYRKVRQLAEAASDKTWPGIFEALRRMTGWSAARVDELRDREEAAELACGFPIVENVRQFEPDALIVTDTYFAEDQVRRLARRIGLPEDAAIVASWDGKWTGRHWKAAGRGTTLHIGDNMRSDVASPQAAGVPARHYGGGAWTAVERGWNDLGQWEVAGAARAARLQNPHAPGTPEARWWDGAAAANVPFVLLAAALVRNYVEAARSRRVAFVSRDAILLGRAYARLYGETPVVFHASRATFRKPSPAFLTYVKRMAADTLFVDLHGTGRSMREFCDRRGIDLAYVFVCGQKRLAPHAPALVPLDAIGTGTAVEVMNYHDQGRVIDVAPDGEPRRSEVEYDIEVVRVHQAATLAGIAACCQPPRGVTAGQVEAAAAEIKRQVPRELLAQHQVDHRAP